MRREWPDQKIPENRTFTRGFTSSVVLQRWSLHCKEVQFVASDMRLILRGLYLNSYPKHNNIQFRWIDQILCQNPLYTAIFKRQHDRRRRACSAMPQDAGRRSTSKNHLQPPSHERFNCFSDQKGWRCSIWMEEVWTKAVRHGGNEEFYWDDSFRGCHDHRRRNEEVCSPEFGADISVSSVRRTRNLLKFVYRPMNSSQFPTILQPSSATLVLIKTQ